MYVEMGFQLNLYQHPNYQSPIQHDPRSRAFSSKAKFAIWFVKHNEAGEGLLHGWTSSPSEHLVQ
jgi:hypothetical protein